MAPPSLRTLLLQPPSSWAAKAVTLNALCMKTTRHLDNRLRLRVLGRRQADGQSQRSHIACFLKFKVLCVSRAGCDKGNSFPFSLIGRNSNFGSIAHWLMGKSLNLSVLSCEGRILIFLARIMAGSYMLPIVTCQINAWYMKVCGGHLHGLCIYWWKNSFQV